MHVHNSRPDLGGWADEDFCYLTTTGRRSGRPRTIEIWFAISDSVLYLLSGGGEDAQWVRNLQADPRVRVRIRRTSWPGRAEVVADPEEDALARRLLAAKYQGWEPGRRLSGWARTALPVAVRF